MALQAIAFALLLRDARCLPSRVVAATTLLRPCAAHGSVVLPPAQAREAVLRMETSDSWQVLMYFSSWALSLAFLGLLPVFFLAAAYTVSPPPADTMWAALHCILIIGCSQFRLIASQLVHWYLFVYDNSGQWLPPNLQARPLHLLLRACSLAAWPSQVREEHTTVDDNQPDPPDAQSPTCPICWGEFEAGEQVATLPCHHTHQFHLECVLSSLQRRGRCPLCSQDVLEAYAAAQSTRTRNGDS